MLDEPPVHAAYQRRLVLVRPDGHVAWRADTEPDNVDAVIDVVRGQSKTQLQIQQGRMT
jgi:hypothetical protein